MAGVQARVALFGAGTIAQTYLDALQHATGFAVVAVCSRDGAGAAAFAREHIIPPRSSSDVLGDPDINYVINLTPAHAHEAVTRACLEAGKSVYSEKPLAATLEGADQLIALADERGLLLACAPATFLWPPLATARRLVAEGRLGTVIGALTTLIYPGPELFHPNPAHLYSAVAGPLRDMGVYQVTALVALLGPVIAVSAMTSRAKDSRVVNVGPLAGQSYEVEAPTYVHAQLRHVGGAISTVVVSFDGLSAVQPRLELFGTRGGLLIERSHEPGAMLTLSDTLGVREPVPPDHQRDRGTEGGIGPISAWLAFGAGQAVETSAHRARDVLAVLLAIEEASVTDSVVGLSPSDAWSGGQ